MIDLPSLLKRANVSNAPASSGPMLIEVVITKQDGVGIDQRQMPQMVRDGPRETVPFLGEYAADVLSDPPHLGTGGGCHETQHHCVHTLEMILGIGEPEGSAPGQPQNGPAIHAKREA